jgi:hypothetical protein
LKGCEEGICEGRYKFVEVRIEELRVFLKGLELAEVRKVQKKKMMRSSIPSLPAYLHLELELAV